MRAKEVVPVGPPEPDEDDLRRAEEAAMRVDLAVLDALDQDADRRSVVRQRDSEQRLRRQRAGLDPDGFSVRERFPALDLAALVDPNRPPRAWLLDDVVPEGDQVSIVAPGGTGKSLFVLALAVAAVTGSGTFIGRRLQLPRDKRVLYIDMENSEDDLAERLPDLGVTPTNALRLQERLVVLHLPPLGGLDTRRGAAELLEILDDYGLGAGDVLVLDSTQRVTEGPENDADTFRNLYNLTSVELKRRGLTVIRTDNTGKDTGAGARGSSGKRDDVGYSWLMEGDKKSETFTLSNSKRRAAGSSDGVRFRRTKVDGVLRFLPAVEVAQGTEAKEIAFKKAASEALRAAHDNGKREGTSGLLTQRELLSAIREADAGVKFETAGKWLSEMVAARFARIEGGQESATRASGSKRQAKYYGWRADYRPPFVDEGEGANEGGGGAY